MSFNNEGFNIYRVTNDILDYMDRVEFPDYIIKLYDRYPYLIPILISIFVTYNIGFSRVFPLWSDPGEWLKYAKAYEAIILGIFGIQPRYAIEILEVMGSQSVFGYPPLSLILLSIYRAILGDVPGVQYYGSTLLVLQTIPPYLIIYRITRVRWLSLFAGIFTAFTPGYMEIFGWGGYPNLLGLFLIGISIYYLIGLLDGEEKIWKPILTSTLIIFTHHLSTALFISILVVWGVLQILIKRDTYNGSRLIALSIYTGIILALYRYGLGFLEDYIIDNEAAYYELRVDYMEMLIWIFKEPIVFLIGLIILGYAFYILKTLDGRIQLLFIAWLISPILLTFGYLFGIALDYNRFLLFLTQPIPILLTLSYIHLKKIYILELIIHWRRKLASTIITFILISYVGLFLINGFIVPYKIDGWYQERDEYGWWGRHDALTWIRDYTDSDSIFAADELMGRWIEGYSHRKSYINTDPKWLFRAGQIEEYLISSALYGGVYEYRSPRFRLYIQADINPRYSLSVLYWRYGDYEPAFYIPLPDIVALYNPYKPTVPQNISESRMVYINENGLQVLYWTNNSLIVIQEIEIIDEDTIYINFDISNSSTKYIGIPFKLDKDTFISFTIEGDIVKLKFDQAYIILEVDGLYDAYLIPWEDDKLVIISDSKSISIKIEFITRLNKNLDRVIFNSIWDLARKYDIDYIVISTEDFRDEGSKYYFLGRIFKVAYNNGFVTILKI